MAVWQNWSGPRQMREIFLPVTYNPTLVAERGAHPSVRVNAAGEVASIEFRVPWDFAAIVDAELVFVGGAGGNGNAMPARIMVTYGDPTTRETYGLFQNNDPSRNLGDVWNQELDLEDISDLLDGIAAGDQCGVYVRYNGGWAPQTDIYVLGVRMRYRASAFDSDASP